MPNQIERLITKSIKGNTRAQIQLYDKYCQAMYNVAFSYLQHQEDAKDAMQDGFIKAFAKLHTYKNTSSFGAWLKRIIINQCIDYLKQKRLETVTDDITELKIVGDTEDWNFSSTITKTQILENVELLSENHKIVVKLYLFEGYDHLEISEILNIPVKTSRTYLRRGRIQLQELLKEKYNEARY